MDDERAAMRAQILAAFDVTEDDMAALDASPLGRAEAQARADHEHFRDVVIPQRIAAVEAQMAAALMPDGYEVTFRPSE